MTDKELTEEELEITKKRLIEKYGSLEKAGEAWKEAEKEAKEILKDVDLDKMKSDKETINPLEDFVKAYAEYEKNVKESDGDVHLNKKDYTKALNIYQIIRNREPKNTFLLYKIGFCHRSLNNFSTCIKILQEAFDLGPEPPVNSLCLQMIGESYYFLKDSDKSLEFILKAIDIAKDPKFKETYRVNLYLGYNYAVLKKYDLAIQYLTKTISIAPNAVDAMDALVFAYKSKGDVKNMRISANQAITHLKVILKSYPDSDYFWNLLSNMYHVLGKNDLAKKAKAKSPGILD